MCIKARWQHEKPRPCSSSFDGYCRGFFRMKQLPQPFAIPKKPTYIKIADDIDLFHVFNVIESQNDVCFLLESLGREEHMSRYSLIGFDPDHQIVARSKTLLIDNESYETDNPYYVLSQLFPTSILARNYAGGLVGYLSYEAMNYFEPSLQLPEHEQFDQFRFGLYLDGLVYDKMTGELFYFYYKKSRMDLVNVYLKQSKSLKHAKTDISVTFEGDSMTKNQYTEMIEATIEEIKKGNSFQSEAGFKTFFSIKGTEKLAIYEKLRNVNPSPFMYYLKFSRQILIGASPELLFRMRDGEMETFPLAGTIKRGKNESEDRRLARQLLHDPKEIAEHNMLVDLHRNDIGKVAQFGTVKVRRLMDVKKFSHVQHISSEISGLIHPNENMFTALASNFPAGTLTGAPKIETMKIIHSHEQVARGPYGGGVGHFGLNGDCTFCIPIRSLFIYEDEAFAQTSSGIVYDSKPENEYKEIQNKLAAMKQVLATFKTK